MTGSLSDMDVWMYEVATQMWLSGVQQLHVKATEHYATDRETRLFGADLDVISGVQQLHVKATNEAEAYANWTDAKLECCAHELVNLKFESTIKILCSFGNS